LLFHIYSIEKKQKSRKPKTKKPQKHLPPFELAGGLKNLPFQLAVAACQSAATQIGPAATIAILLRVEMAACSYRRSNDGRNTTAILNDSSRLFLPMLNSTIYFLKSKKKYKRIRVSLY
jgi:hypothetical protein